MCRKKKNSNYTLLQSVMDRSTIIIIKINEKILSIICIWFSLFFNILKCAKEFYFTSTNSCITSGHEYVYIVMNRRII
jgi:hypothetical protein